MASKIREKRLAASKKYRENNKELLAKKARAYQKENPDIYRQAAAKHYHKNRLRILAKRYGVPESSLESLSNCCEICGSTYKLCIDHCHTSGIVRGMLCDSCNRGIGFLGESVERLLEAIAYLDKHRYLKIPPEGEYAVEEPESYPDGDAGLSGDGTPIAPWNPLYNIIYTETDAPYDGTERAC